MSIENTGHKEVKAPSYGHWAIWILTAGGGFLLGAFPVDGVPLGGLLGISVLALGAVACATERSNLNDLFGELVKRGVVVRKRTAGTEAMVWADTGKPLKALDGYWRRRRGPFDVMPHLDPKQDKNFAQKCLTPTSDDVAVERDRSSDANQNGQ